MERATHSCRGQASSISPRATKRAISIVETGETRRSADGTASAFRHFMPSRLDLSNAQINDALNLLGSAEGGTAAQRR